LHQCILPRGHAEGDRASAHKTSVAGKMIEWRFKYGRTRDERRDDDRGDRPTGRVRY
jgi:hypothetical protein